MALIRIIKDGTSVDMVCDSYQQAVKMYPYHRCVDVTPKAAVAREWRDSELVRTDALAILPDHPQKTEIAAYRTALRDWPSTSEFPNTKPTLGS
jgi:hypothetical protein